MPKLTWTKKQIDLLKENYPFLKLEDVSVLVEKTPKAAKTKAKVLGLKKLIKHYADPWEEEEEEYLIRYYTEMTAKQIGEALNKTKASVKNRLNKIKLFLPEELREKRKLSTSFKPGSISYNKGKKWDDFMSKEAQDRSRKTTFKTGNLPYNTKSDNAISIRTDSRGVAYKWIRIKLGEWQMLHVFNYIKKNGLVPEGYNVFFKNGDTMNCDPENLKLETRAENMKRNSIHNYPEEIQITIRLLTKLNKTIHGKEQNSRPAESSI